MYNYIIKFQISGTNNKFYNLENWEIVNQIEMFYT